MSIAQLCEDETFYEEGKLEEGERKLIKLECLPLEELLSECVNEMQHYRTRHILAEWNFSGVPSAD